MKALRLIFLYMFLMFLPSTAAGDTEFIALAYHDVVDHRYELTFDGITLNNLVDHFEWFKVNGYNPISIDELIAASNGTNTLPDKPILLCWDDAYLSFYEKVLPLLKAYKYPAVLALVGEWMEADVDDTVQYGNEQVPRTKFMTWEMVREAVDSGFVEIASHSYNLHTTVLAGPLGDSLPSVLVQKYDFTTSEYETEDEYRERIRTDLLASKEQIKAQVGVEPRVMVWPFGRFNAAALDAAAQAGMDITLTLSPVPANTDRLSVVGRIYPTLNPDLKTFRSYLKTTIRPSVKHFFKVESDDLLEPSALKEQNFSLFLDRVKELSPNMVILDPVTEESGKVETLFINDRFPVSQDRLRRITWHTGKKAQTGVHLRLTSSLFTQRSGETIEDVLNFFSDMGKAGPGEGLIVDDTDFISNLLVAPVQEIETKEVVFWNPEKNRYARQKKLRSTDNEKIFTVLSSLEAFQQWQPFLEISAVISLDYFDTMELLQFKTLLKYFDFLIIDAGDTTVRQLRKKYSKKFETLYTNGMLRKMAIYFDAEYENNKMAKKLYELPKLDIINWGYKVDNFIEGKPSSITIRPLLLKKSFPYPLLYK